jgi:hypothetical protein
MTFTTFMELAPYPEAPGLEKPKWSLITLLEFAHAIAELPDCHYFPSDSISVPNHGAGEYILRPFPGSLPRPQVITFTKVGVQESYGPDIRWALSDTHRIIV